MFVNAFVFLPSLKSLRLLLNKHNRVVNVLKTLPIFLQIHQALVASLVCCIAIVTVQRCTSLKRVHEYFCLSSFCKVVFVQRSYATKMNKHAFKPNISYISASHCCRKYISASGLKTHWKTGTCVPPEAIARYSVMVDAAMGLDKDSPESLQNAEATSTPESDFGSYLASRCSEALRDTAEGSPSEADSSDYSMPRCPDSEFRMSKISDPEFMMAQMAERDFRPSKLFEQQEFSKYSDPGCRIPKVSEADFRMSKISEDGYRTSQSSERDCRVPNLSEEEDRAGDEDVRDMSPASGHHQHVIGGKVKDEKEEEEEYKKEGLEDVVGFKHEREQRSPDRCNYSTVSSNSRAAFSPPIHTAQPLFA